MLTIDFPLQVQKIAIVLNGEMSQLSLNNSYEHWRNYEKIIVVDGAWDNFIDDQGVQHIVNVRSKQLVCMGDGDSITQKPEDFITTSDQNYTDFEKAIRFVTEKGYDMADVYWGSGLAMDHFLGNLSVAAKYHQHISLRFIDNHSYYVYLSKLHPTTHIINAKGKTISLYPFPEARLRGQGLKYPLNNLLLNLSQQQSLRNEIVSEQCELKCLSGSAWCFIGINSTSP